MPVLNFPADLPIVTALYRDRDIWKAAHDICELPKQANRAATQAARVDALASLEVKHDAEFVALVKQRVEVKFEKRKLASKVRAEAASARMRGFDFLKEEIA